MKNKKKLANIINKVCGKLKLNLSGVTVLTEAANSYYSSTACIAAYAGAKVYAYAEDNKYSSSEEKIKDVKELAEELGVTGKISFIKNLSEYLTKADIVTNSLALRPFNKDKLQKMAPGTKLLLMYEEWEKREGEIDYDYCMKHDIDVIPTDEHNKIKVFDYVGVIVIKYLLEKNFSILNEKITVIGRDKFADTVADYLSRNGARMSRIKDKRDFGLCKGSDLLIYCDYFNALDIDWVKVMKINPGTQLFIFTGIENNDSIIKSNINIINDFIPGYKKMALTFEYIGCRPVVELVSLSYKEAMDR